MFLEGLEALSYFLCTRVVDVGVHSVWFFYQDGLEAFKLLIPIM